MSLNICLSQAEDSTFILQRTYKLDSTFNKSKNLQGFIYNIDNRKGQDLILWNKSDSAQIRILKLDYHALTYIPPIDTLSLDSLQLDSLAQDSLLLDSLFLGSLAQDSIALDSLINDSTLVELPDFIDESVYTFKNVSDQLIYVNYLINKEFYQPSLVALTIDETSSTINILTNSNGVDALLLKYHRSIEDFIIKGGVVRDLNNDGNDDIIVWSEDEVKVFSMPFHSNGLEEEQEINTNDEDDELLRNVFSKKFESNEVLSVYTRDINHDSYADFVIVTDESQILFKNDSYLSFKEEIEYQFFSNMIPVNTEFDIVGNDAVRDLLVADQNDNLSVVDESFDLRPLNISYHGQFSAVDINNDGYRDLISSNIHGQSPELFLGGPFSKYERNTNLLSDSSLIGSMIFTLDLNYDGSVDFISLNDSSASYFINKSKEANREPFFKSLNRQFRMVRDNLELTWDPAFDDHTSSEEISYELFVSGIIYQNLALDYTDSIVFRTITNLGKHTSKPMFNVKIEEPGLYHWGVIGVDNADHFKAKFSGSGDPANCGGSGGGICINIESKDGVYCPGDTLWLKLPTGQLAEWYSFKEGSLGLKDSIQFVVKEDDMIFGNSRSEGGLSRMDSQNSDNCLDNLFYSIRTYKENETVENLCIGTEFILPASPIAYDRVIVDNFTGQLMGNDTVRIEEVKEYSYDIWLDEEKTCPFGTFKLHGNKVDILSSNTSYDILHNDSISISLSGGVRYTLFDGFDHQDIEEELGLRPPLDTTFSVFAYDIYDCKDSVDISVNVSHKLFIPTLFTPNDDGVDDQFKIYGSAFVEGFSWTIYNRSGEVVYQTENLRQAVRSGWDGKLNGVKLPADMYYWKLGGKFPEGENANAEGKTMGYFNLAY
ncbi:T9SS type B sorting domain-containing protein [Aureibacter tunicatorum]|uniref:Gliding motility-associated-like protein n=1 Tax=Aureibacter tunicatorum TaxID=866807 RepID=A0AAE3XS35_9BACT|nr:gliding motility-associated C-terminal domain-containing protein [Aureibacter tunicatorum]MDR6241004.1 gliding motility-associated-like protein [Aureibacter tunicatorum]